MVTSRVVASGGAVTASTIATTTIAMVTIAMAKTFDGSAREWHEDLEEGAQQRPAGSIIEGRALPKL